MRTLKKIVKALESFTWTIFNGEMIKWTVIFGIIVVFGNALLEAASMNTFISGNEGRVIIMIVWSFLLIAMVVEGIIGVHDEFHPSEWARKRDLLNEKILKQHAMEMDLKELLTKKSTIRIFSGTEDEAIRQYEEYLKENTKKEPRIGGIISCESPVASKTGEEYTVSMVCDIWELKEASKQGQYSALEAKINEYDLEIGDLEKVVCERESEAATDQSMDT